MSVWFYYENPVSGLGRLRYRLDHHLQPHPFQPPDEPPPEMVRALPVEVAPAQLLVAGAPPQDVIRDHEDAVADRDQRPLLPFVLTRRSFTQSSGHRRSSSLRCFRPPPEKEWLATFCALN